MSSPAPDPVATFAEGPKDVGHPSQTPKTSFYMTWVFRNGSGRRWSSSCGSGNCLCGDYDLLTGRRDSNALLHGVPPLVTSLSYRLT